ncbi:MAG: hypothetical protein LBK62_00645 [Treponema sp.]|nr:hypothetical protein [Treponema sp.]
MMYHRSFGKVTRRSVSFIILLVVGYWFAGCATSSVAVTRAGTYMDDGKLFVYLDGILRNRNQPIAKGQTKTIAVSNGLHTIWVKVESLESDKIQFTTKNSTVNFNAAIERIAGSKYLLLERELD